MGDPAFEMDANEELALQGALSCGTRLDLVHKTLDERLVQLAKHAENMAEEVRNLTNATGYAIKALLDSAPK